jgi:hypothetical protein
VCLSVCLFAHFFARTSRVARLLVCSFLFASRKDGSFLSKNPYFCSQPQEVVDEENYFGVNSYSAFQPFSAQIEDCRIEGRVSKRVEKKAFEGDEEIQIVSTPMKRVAPKKKVAPRKKIAKVEVKVEGEDNDGARTWLNAEVLQLIALQGEMEPDRA